MADLKWCYPPCAKCGRYDPNNVRTVEVKKGRNVVIEARCTECTPREEGANKASAGFWR